MRNDDEILSEAGSTAFSEDGEQDAERTDVAEAGAQRLKALLGEVNGIDYLSTAKVHSSIEVNNDTQNDKDADAEAYAFRLFASKPSATSPDQDSKHTLVGTKISLAANDQPSSGANEGLNSVATKQRPRSYYIVESNSYIPTNELREAAIDGASVLKLSNPGIARPGMAQPWKVIHIQERATKETHNDSTTVRRAGKASGDLAKSKRCRKGKKTRIKIRIRMRALEAERKAPSGKSANVPKRPAPMPANVTAGAQAASQPGTDGVSQGVQKQASLSTDFNPSISKEQHLAEKKRMLNRKKQLKKREKAREEKKAHQLDTGV